MTIRTINVITKEETVRDLTSEEIVATLLDNPDRIAERTPKPKVLTIETLAELLKTKLIITDVEIEAAKK